MIARTRLVLGCPAIAVLLLAGCGDDETGSGPSPTGPQQGCAVVEGGEVTIVAKDLAWDVDCIHAPEGIAFTVVVDNQDDGVNHDLQVVLDDEILRTPLEAGPVVQRLDFPALDAGEHPYICDVHPNMTGTLEVLEPLSEGTVLPPQ